MPTERRQQAEAQGRRAETLCAWTLRLGGWRIMARRFVTGRGTGAGEVDLIARKGGLVAFIEVKARATTDEALAAVSPRQRRRIEAGAAAFLAAHPELADLDCRFDVMAVPTGGWPHHLADAWRPGD